MTVERSRSAGRLLAWKSLLVLTLGAVGLIAQLPPAVQADRYAVRAQAALEEQDYARARVALEKILELQAQHDLFVPAEFYFQYADVLQRTGAAAVALENVRHYLERAGREGESYMAALKLMDRLEREIAQLENAERYRLAKEREARAERERVARVAAERLNAARKLSEEMEFVRIPAGTFRMGSKSKLAASDQRPLRQVRISRAFEIGKYEVTNLEWWAVMGRNSSSQCGRCPITGVSWNEVQEFIGILNQAAGQGTRYRLPTEAEWEYAARAGTKGERYASSLDAIAWHGGNSDRALHAVGGKQPNAFGLHDMLGSVWEWVQDWYGPYSGSSVTDPAGPATGRDRVRRGCSWLSVASYCRAARRSYSAPGSCRDYLGFRLARTVQ